MTETITKPEKNEIATTRDGRDITRGFVNNLPLLPSQDSLLALKGNGSLKIYQEVLRDEQVKACFNQRVRAVISRPWEVRAGGTKLQDKKAAEFVTEQLKKLAFDDITEKMLYGVFYGYAVAEAIWAIDGSTIVAKEIRVRDRVRFAFAPDMSLRLKTMQHPMGEILPDRKFWHFCTGADHHDEPYGLGLAHWLYWAVFFKRNGIKFWLTFLEKFGTPTAKGTYQPGTSDEEQDKLLNALRDIQNDSAVIMPEGMTAELLEATRSGTADYKSLVELMDNAIAKVTLGQTASTQGTAGRLGNDDLQGDVRLDIVKADADLVCMSFNNTIVRWLTEWNFPGAAIPQVWRIVEEPEDLNQRSERDSKINSMGFKPKLAYINETYGGDWEEKAPEPDQNRLPGNVVPINNARKPAEFAEGSVLWMDQAVEDAASDWQEVMEPMLNPLLKALDEAVKQGKSTAEFAQMLPDLLKQADTRKLQNDLTRATFFMRALGEAGVLLDNQLDNQVDI